MKLIPALRLTLEPTSPDVVAVVGGGGKSSTIFRLAQEIVASGKRVVTTTTTRIAVRQIENAPACLRLADERLPLAELTAALDLHGHCLLVGDEILLNGKQSGVAASVVDRLVQQSAELNLAAILVEADGSRTLPVKAPGPHEPVIPQSCTLLLPVIGLDAIGALIDADHVHRPDLVRLLLGLGEGEAVRLTPAMAAQLLVDERGGAKALPPAARLLPLLNKADGAARRASGRVMASLLANRGQPSLLTATGQPTLEPVLERWGPVGVVVLAAGASTRFGRPKQLEVVDGEAMVVRAVRCAVQSGAQQVVVVSGAHADAVEAVLAPLLTTHPRQLQLVHNSDWQQGQATSVHTGLAALSAATEAAIFLPVDQPFVESLLLRRLIGAWRGGGQLAAPLVDGELRGAPALFDREFWPELRQLEGDLGGRVVLRRHTDQVIAIPALHDQLRDIDTPSDLSQIG